MPGPSRREMVQRSLGATFAVLAGCPSRDDGDSGAPSCGAVDEPVAGGAFIGEIPFAEEDDALPPGTLYGDGLDGRQNADLSLLTEAAPLMSPEAFYVRTAPSSLLDVDRDWTIAVTGLVEPVTLRLVDLLGHVVGQGAIVMECSGNTRSARFGLMSAATWAGIPLSAVFARLSVDPRATRVRIAGFDTYPAASENSSPGCDWVFRLDELDGAFLATELDGAPLPLEHGFPVRLVLPGWYGCCQPKWLTELAFTDDDAPATEHMKEFAERTMQAQPWDLARDFAPATIDPAALPVRVELWRVGDRYALKIVGILWGAAVSGDSLHIGFAGGPKVPVDSCPSPSDGRTWTLWSHLWFPDVGGRVSVDLAIDGAVTRRMDSGWYRRWIDVPR